MRKMRLVLVLLNFGLLCILPTLLSGAEYTVNSGGSINDAIGLLQPGDTLYVRGGVYREKVTIGASGTVGNRITIRNYPDEQPVIDGSEVLTGWTKCTSAIECGGNSNWQNIYYTYAPAGTELFTANLYQNDEILSIAQNPNPSNPYYMDNENEYLFVSLSNTTDTSITDSRLAGFGGVNLVGSYVAALVSGNNVGYTKITDYISVESKIIIESTTFYTVDGNAYYSIINNLQENILDKPGEFFFNETPETDGTHKVYLWSLNNQDLENAGEVTVSVRNEIINLANNSYITIEGLKIKKAIARAIFSGWGSITGIIIRDMEITKGRTHVPLPNNMIYLFDADNSLIDNNYLHHNTGLYRGMVIRGDNVKVTNNIIDTQGGDPIYFANVHNGQIINNTITNCRGKHANGITMYGYAPAGEFNNNILVANNKIINSNILIAIATSSNFTFYNNILHSADNKPIVVAGWGGLSGTIAFFNNIIIGSSGDDVFSLSAADMIISKNNIIDGDNDWGLEDVRGYNIYTKLGSMQNTGQGWTIEEGGIVETDLTVLFNDETNYDMTTKPGSLGIDNGTNILADLPDYLNDPFFSDYDFTKDIEGNIRPQGAAWDIGAYEYKAGGVPPDLDSEDSIVEPPVVDPEADGDPITIEKTALSARNNIIKAGSHSNAIIRCDIKEAGNLSVKIYDSKGKEIVTLFDGSKAAGRHEFLWAGVDSGGSKVGSGIYMVNMKIGSYSKTSKIAVVK